MKIEFKIHKDFNKFVFNEFTVDKNNMFNYKNYVIDYIEGNCPRDNIKTRMIYKTLKQYKKFMGAFDGT